MVAFKFLNPIVTVILIISANRGNSQQISLNLHKNFKLQVTLKLPDNLLVSKSAVIVKLANRMETEVPDGHWKEISALAHNDFKRTGIDAVAYYYHSDIFSGVESQRAIADFLTKREIKNLIFIQYDKNENNSIVNYSLIIVPFSDNENFIVDGASGWIGQDTELKRITNRIYREAVPAQERTNFLISEAPEFFEDARIIRGSREEKFPVDLKSFKLGVPVWDPDPGNTADMEQIMEQYPLPFEIVDANPDENTVRNMNGAHFILYYINTSGSTIRRMLDYNSTEEKRFLSVIYKDGKSEVVSQSGSSKVYKFYIKHIATGNVFLGSVWDAHPSREIALRSFLWNLKNDLKL